MGPSDGAIVGAPVLLGQVNDGKVGGVYGSHMRQVDLRQQRTAVVVVIAAVSTGHPRVARYDDQSAKGGRFGGSERLGEKVRQTAAVFASPGKSERNFKKFKKFA